MAVGLIMLRLLLMMKTGRISAPTTSHQVLAQRWRLAVAVRIPRTRAPPNGIGDGEARRIRRKTRKTAITSPLARLLLLVPVLLTALFSLGVGVFAAMPWSPLDWARLIVRREYVGG